MTPKQFMAWRVAMGKARGKADNTDPRVVPYLSDRETAKILGASYMAVRAWSSERDAPTYIALACAALAAGLKPWTRAS